VHALSLCNLCQLLVPVSLQNVYYACCWESGHLVGYFLLNVGMGCGRLFSPSLKVYFEFMMQQKTWYDVMSNEMLICTA